MTESKIREKQKELEILEKTINQKENTKVHLVFENLLKRKYKLFYKKAMTREFNEEDLLNLNLFYMKERNNRLLYNDPELHVLIVSLVMCLIITPSRGTFDDLYCSPLYDFNKINILYILSHHLNHQDNQEILPDLLKLVAEIQPYGSGQRLLKLLCVSLFDSSFYKSWERIAVGAYGKVFQCTTSLEEPAMVAIKKIDTPENIYDPCNLFDIFTEITALETFRLEGCVTHLFDYGVDNDSYYIIMKKYQMSLKEWRGLQTKSLNDMMFIYLNIFKDILKAVSTIHFHKTTHYDIKCDNIVIDFTSLDDSLISDENSICVKIADFGECKMFIDEDDEYCVRSRGTNVIKSPEMLINLGYNVRKDDDKFDRRKKLGTTRASDIWSLGCLFYELLTGKFLFEEVETDYLGFMMKANTVSVSELLTEEKVNDLNGNPYLIDFLKYMLVRDQTYRPNIEAVMKRFEHVHALLANIGSGSNSNTMHLTKRFNQNIDQCLETCMELLANNTDNLMVNKATSEKIRFVPSILKISEDMYLCDFNYAENNFNKLYNLGITHVISWSRSRNKELNDRLLFLNLLEGNTGADSDKNPFSYIFKVMDFIRHCMIYKGCILFIDDYQFQGVQFKPNFLIRSLIILSVSFILNLNAYDTWTYLNTKLLYFQLPIQDLSNLSTWVLNQSQVYNTIFSYPVIRCICGACVLVLKRTYTNINSMNYKTCSCSTRSKNTEYSECPSNGCMNYIQQIKVNPPITI
jgi:serine/threonine protein kinase